MIPHSVKQGNKFEEVGGIGNIGSGLHKIGELGPFANYLDQKTFLAFSF